MSDVHITEQRDDRTPEDDQGPTTRVLVSWVTFGGVRYRRVAFDHESVEEATNVWSDGVSWHRPIRELLRARSFVVLNSIVFRIMVSRCFGDCHEGVQIKEEYDVLLCPVYLCRNGIESSTLACSMSSNLLQKYISVWYNCLSLSSL